MGGAKLSLLFHFLLQPKNFKEFWFVFRALESDEKILEYYINERKFLEGLPKGMIHLSDVKSVQKHDPDKKNQFSIEMVDGSICFFEVGSSHEAEEWTTCLNAVLFGRGPNGGGHGSLSSVVIGDHWRCWQCLREFSLALWLGFCMLLIYASAQIKFHGVSTTL